MRATFLLLLLILCIITSIALELFGDFLLGIEIIFLVLLVLGSIFMDKAILFFLGAREVRSGDQPEFFEAAAQAAYKLAIPLPKIFIYEGSFERGFVLENRGNNSLILSRSFLLKMNQEELSGVCFSLLLQVKKKIVSKRTKVMFLIGGGAWGFNNIIAFVIFLIPSKNLQKIILGIFSYFFNPILNLFFDLVMGQSYFKKLLLYLQDFPEEMSALKVAGLKLQKTPELYSLPSRKLFELSYSTRSTSFKNILILEMLPHEWDYFFLNQGLLSASKN